ncbi:hypothetical protein HAX54_045050 [Datura stramonium]|uniref:Uncharacterized protein n=1 Tax=Datura stramonium TaxID=4076 RepID=A0ABS8SQ43_DATST|nr:hypothetical protein [Datura stramonium]
MLHIGVPESINYLPKREGGRIKERNWLIYFTYVKYSWLSFVWYDWKSSKSDSFLHSGQFAVVLPLFTFFFAKSWKIVIPLFFTYISTNLCFTQVNIVSSLTLTFS